MPTGVRERDCRGSSTDRQARRLWLLSPAAGHGGNGQRVPCFRCSTRLTILTLTVDRIVPGCDGGTYRRDNIRPACAPCNSETGGRTRGTAWPIVCYVEA